MRRKESAINSCWEEEMTGQRQGRIWPGRGEMEGTGFGLMDPGEGCLVSDPHILLGMLLNCHL